MYKYISKGYMHSPKGLLGTPANFLLMQLSNQPITWQLLQCIWSWSRQSPELQTDCQNGKER